MELAEFEAHSLPFAHRVVDALANVSADPYRRQKLLDPDRLDAC